MSKPRNAPRAADRAIARIPLNRICLNPQQPRRQLPADSIAPLAESIRLHGLLSPLLVRGLGDGHYQLIAGERRLRALERLGRTQAECVVLSADDCDCALIALVENLQREDLHYLDMAAACRRILDRHPITQERLAASLSMSPSALANRLRLLKLPANAQAAIRRCGLGERQARALLRLDDEAAQMALIARAAERRMGARELETAVAQCLRPPAKPPRVSRMVRDSRIIINAVLDTVRELKRIGVPVTSRVEEGADRIDVIVTIPVRGMPEAGKA